MTDKEIIEKATKVLKALDLLADYTNIGVYKEINPMVLEIDPDVEFEYSVHFNFNPPIRGTGATITVDRKTHKLLKIITKSGLYSIPEDLQ
ncbi:hypothetical protein [Chryseobacterium lathyri]|uniref:Immunity protein 35 domain-containing protein n=1 Tax=Chryseobacterium lathyri TaxID=395933 RepID=A0ABT9SGW5_9FLAO|nr:hypothetical protein [Chryseobacterium lathyri]MDP9958655.1 hypothetical protein [Chryseobacterium lathyri]